MHKPDCEQLEDSKIITDNTSLYDWLQAKAQKENLTYLLAHADDGVIWGHFKDGKLETSGDVFSQCAKLHLCTLQQCRIFGKKAEVMLWKAGESWKACLINDEYPSKYNDYICEKQILWGTQAEEEHNKGFTLVSDGSQGLKHAVPLINISFNKDKKNLSRPIRLVVHHYIQYDDSGIARIYLSRLVDLQGNE